jgi:hypothetical protein
VPALVGEGEVVRCKGRWRGWVARSSSMSLLVAAGCWRVGDGPGGRPRRGGREERRHVQGGMSLRAEELGVITGRRPTPRVNVAATPESWALTPAGASGGRATSPECRVGGKGDDGCLGVVGHEGEGGRRSASRWWLREKPTTGLGEGGREEERGLIPCSWLLKRRLNVV